MLVTVDIDLNVHTYKPFYTWYEFTTFCLNRESDMELMECVSYKMLISPWLIQNSNEKFEIEFVYLNEHWDLF